MDYFDLHCDTAQNFLHGKETLETCTGHISLKKLRGFDRYCQVFALFIHDNYQGNEAFFHYQALHHGLKRQLELYSEKFVWVTGASSLNAVCGKEKNGAVLSVENGAALGGRLENLTQMAKDGVKLFTLTWFGENELGYGSGADDRGLKPFGRKVLQKLYEYDIIPDISHLSDKGVCDVFRLTDKTVVATHSNARAVMPHFRNLTDDMIKEIVKRKGLIGLNFCEAFLIKEPLAATFSEIRKQIEHFWKLGAQNALCFGSDFDGAKVPACIADIGGIPRLYDYLRQYGYTEEFLQKLFFDNACAFFEKQWA